MSSENKPTANGLTPKEIAAITACVPCSGTPYIDAIITQGLRFRTATSAMEAMFREGYGAGWSNEMLAHQAIELADALIEAFRKN